MKSNFFDKYYKRYDAWYERNKFAYLSELEALRQVLPKKGKGLEIGVGTGRFASALGIRYGIDCSKKMLEIAQKRGIETGLCYGERLPFRNFSFDYVAVIITLCFVADPVRVLLEARRVLKRKGKIVLGLIDKESFLGKFYQRKKSVFYNKADFLGMGELTSLLKNMGFRKISYYQTIYELPHKIRSIQKPEKGFGRGGFIVIGAYKYQQKETKTDKKFRQYERVRLLFRRYGYDMDLAILKIYR